MREDVACRCPEDDAGQFMAVVARAVCVVIIASLVRYSRLLTACIGFFWVFCIRRPACNETDAGGDKENPTSAWAKHVHAATRGRGYHDDVSKRTGRQYIREIGPGERSKIRRKEANE